MGLAEGVLKGHTQALARLITLIEDDPPAAHDELKALYPHTGKSYIIGITGPSGSGKSSLVDKMITLLRSRGKSLGVIAVDPSSPFSGGAILGDRIRMQRHSTDDGVFIRSMATRGALGGLSAGASDAVVALDASGKEIILVETVGVGQDEVEIAKMAHTTVVVTMPGLGDDVQVIKAGILEIGDVFAVNKADRDGADDTARELESMLLLGNERREGWRPPVIKTVAVEGGGVDELVEAACRHRQHLEGSGGLCQRIRMQARITLLDRLKESLARQVVEDLGGEAEFEKYVQAVATREMDPYRAVEELVGRAGKQRFIASADED